MSSSSQISRSSSAQPSVQNTQRCETLRAHWLSLTLLVVGIIGIIVGNFALANTARYATIIGGSFACALSLFGFCTSCINKPTYTDINDLWSHIVPESEWKGDYNIFAALTANPLWFSRNPLIRMMSEMTWDVASVKYGDEAYEKALIENINFNAENLSGETALHMAAKKGRGGVNYLLILTQRWGMRSSLNINYHNSKGETPLHYAYKALNDAINQVPVESEAIECCTRNISLLFKAGADPTVKAHSTNLTPLEYLDEKHRSYYQKLIDASLV